MVLLGSLSPSRSQRNRTHTCLHACICMHAAQPSPATTAPFLRPSHARPQGTPLPRRLEVLVPATLRLPPSLLSRFTARTGWEVAVTPLDACWAAVAASFPPPPAATTTTTTTAAPSPSLAASGAPPWSAAAALQGYDAWILDPQLLAGLARAGAVERPDRGGLEPSALAELAAATDGSLRRCGVRGGTNWPSHYVHLHEMAEAMCTTCI